MAETKTIGLTMVALISLLVGGYIATTGTPTYYCESRDTAYECDHLSSTNKTCYLTSSSSPSKLCSEGWKLLDLEKIKSDNTPVEEIDLPKLEAELIKNFTSTSKAALSEITIERIESSPYNDYMAVMVRIDIVEFGSEETVHHYGAVNIPKSVFNESVMYDRAKEYGIGLFNALYNRTSAKVVIEVNKTI